MLNKKIILISSFLFLLSCGCASNKKDPLDMIFSKKYAFAGMYMPNKENEMNWIKTNFDKINFTNGENGSYFAYMSPIEGKLIKGYLIQTLINLLKNLPSQ